MPTFRDPPANRPLFDQMAPEPLIDEDWFRWHLALVDSLNRGITVTIPLAKITGGGTDGTLTIINGLVTAVTQPT